MTFKEFETELNKLGMFIKEDEGEFYIKTAMCGFEVYVANVNRNELHSISTGYKNFNSLGEHIKEKLIHLLLNFSSTPIDCREYNGNIEQYYLKLTLNGLTMQKTHVSYLNQFKGVFLYTRGAFSIGNNIESNMYKTKFTQDEIDKIPEYIVCYFEKILVEDEKNK